MHIIVQINILWKLFACRITSGCMRAENTFPSGARFCESQMNAINQIRLPFQNVSNDHDIKIAISNVGIMNLCGHVGRVFSVSVMLTMDTSFLLLSLK